MHPYERQAEHSVLAASEPPKTQVRDRCQRPRYLVSSRQRSVMTGWQGPLVITMPPLLLPPAKYPTAMVTCVPRFCTR